MVDIAELVWDSERGTQHCQASTVDSPTQPWSSWTSCSAVHISHHVQYNQTKYLPRNKSEREHKLCTSTTFQNWQSACARTDNTVVHRERDREVCVESCSSDWWAGIARVCERITNAFEDEPHACTSTSYCQSPLLSYVTRTQQRHSMSESDEAQFEHSHKRTWPYYESGSSPIPDKLTAPSKTAVCCSGWPMLLSEQRQSWDDFPQGCRQNVFEA